jgi:proteasome lid subunit RPN8/RPN11
LAGNREVCGTVLLNKDGTLALCFADNDSHRAHSFQISGESLRMMEELALRTNSTIIGSFHSHPSGIAEPGDADLQGEDVGKVILIHSCLTGRTRLWRIALENGSRTAVEVPLEVRSRRARSFSPLPPSRSVEGVARDVRSRP